LSLKLQALREWLFPSQPHTAPDEKSRSLAKATYKDLSQLSAHVIDALLGVHLSRGRWLRR
jgi:hypothetical protein